MPASQRSLRPPRRRTQAQRSALSDDRMTSAAVDLLASAGVAGTTLAAIGQAAGYSRGLATQRFGSKAGLLRHVIQRVSREWLRRLDKAVGDKAGLAALEAALDTHLDFMRESPKDVRAMYLLWFQSIDPAAEYRPNVAEVHRQQRDGAARWLVEGQARGTIDPAVDVRQVAEFFCAAVAGIVFHWLVNPEFNVEPAKREMKLQLAARLPGSGPDA